MAAAAGCTAAGAAQRPHLLTALPPDPARGAAAGWQEGLPHRPVVAVQVGVPAGQGVYHWWFGRVRSPLLYSSRGLSAASRARGCQLVEDAGCGDGDRRGQEGSGAVAAAASCMRICGDPETHGRRRSSSRGDDGCRRTCLFCSSTHRGGSTAHACRSSIRAAWHSIPRAAIMSLGRAGAGNKVGSVGCWQLLPPPLSAG